MLGLLFYSSIIVRIYLRYDRHFLLKIFNRKVLFLMELQLQKGFQLVICQNAKGKYSINEIMLFFLPDELDHLSYECKMKPIFPTCGCAWRTSIFLSYEKKKKKSIFYSYMMLGYYCCWSFWHAFAF